jgi:ubiquinone/menaquinone biosynthesis C-methylase UbiE
MMLNPAFLRQGQESQLSRYVLSTELSERAFAENASLCNGAELRLQAVYAEELWKKVRSLGLANLDWGKLDVLDICCGSGFLSFHLLSRIYPASLTLLDASRSELEEAEVLLTKHYPEMKPMYVKADLTKSGLASGSFDLIIGNSFLHHLCDMPGAVSEFRRLLKPGGVFVTLHEPTPAAIAYESGRWDLVAQFFAEGPGYIENLRQERAADICGGVDVWLLEHQTIRDVFEDEGFEHVMAEGWHIFRPFVVAAMKLHLHREKPMLTQWEVILLQLGIGTDALLRGILPPRAFGSLALSARKPATS